jgi:hypothetical protein
MGSTCSGARNTSGTSYRETEKEIAKFEIEDLQALSTYSVEVQTKPPTQIVYAQESQRVFLD